MPTESIDSALANAANVATTTGSRCRYVGESAALLPIHHGSLPFGAFVIPRVVTLCRLARRRPSLVWLGCVFVAAVSVHDALLVVVNHAIILDVEQNPIGAWILAAQGGDVWLFVLLKLAGTALVCAVLVTITQSYRRLGMITVGALATLQMLLLCYLTLI